MKKNKKLMLMGGVFIATLINITLGFTVSKVLDCPSHGMIIVANAQESTELKLSIKKNKETIFEENLVESTKDEVKRNIQDEEERIYQEKVAQEEAERQRELERQAAIEFENYLKEINPYYNETIKIKTSFYSEHESTDVPGNEILTSVGTRLFDGVIAAPYEIPLYSIFLINNQLYMVLDRGNPSYVKMLDGEQKMKIDMYVPNTTSNELKQKGIVNTECKIIRYGGEKKNMQNDIDKMLSINNKIINGENVDIIKEFY